LRLFLGFATAMLCSIIAAATLSGVYDLALTPALAQQTLTATDGSSFVANVWEKAEPIIITAVVSLIGVIAAWLSTWVADFFKVQNAEKRQRIEALTRDLVHSVAWNAIKYAAAKSDSQVMDKLSSDLPPPRELINIAVDYFETMNPDLHEALSRDELEKIITSKLPDLISLTKSKVETPSTVLGAPSAPGSDVTAKPSR